MKDRLATLENRLQELIEIRLVNALLGPQAERLVAQRLAAAIQPLETEGDAQKPAPDVYTLLVHPQTAARWQATPQISETLLDILKSAAGETGVHFASPPEITIAADMSLGIDDVQIVASYRVESLGETKGVTGPSANKPENESSENLPENAFLIVDSVKVFPLDKSVINIGRRLGNHLVINDPRVSRNHAQLRAIKGRFVLFDLDSTGGTYINGQRVSQSVLYPGDVISLAGVPLIFGQDNPIPRPDLVDTAPLSPESGDRPTAILRSDTEKNEK